MADAERGWVIAVLVASADLSGDPDEHCSHAHQLSGGKERHGASPRLHGQGEDCAEEPSLAGRQSA